MGNILDDWFGIEPPKAPKPPDPVTTATTQQQFNAETAAAQQQYNLDALRTNISANRLDQTTPFMSVNYSPTGVDQYGNTTYGVNTQYSPEQQMLLDLLQDNQGGFGQFAADLIRDLETNSVYSEGIPDFADMMNPLMQRHLGIMNPYYEQQKDKLDNDLRNQGLFPGTPGYDNAMRTLLQTQSESVGQFVNQSMPTVMAQYEQPLNIIQRIMGATGPAGMSNLGLQTPPGVNMNAPTVGGVDFMSAQNAETQALMKQYEQQYAQYAGQINALGGIAGTILGAPTGTVMGNLVGAGAGGLTNFLGLGGAAGTQGSTLPLFRLPTSPTAPRTV